MARPQLHTIEVPPNTENALARQLEGIQLNFEALFRDVEDVGDVQATDLGDLAYLDTVATAQIDDEAVTGAKLDSGSDAPGNSKYYGTDGSGTFGFHALPSGGSAWDQEITKASDETVTSSTTFQSDDELVLSMAAADEVWFIEMIIVASAVSATPDIKMQMTHSGGALTNRGWWMGQGLTTALSANDAPLAITQQQTFGIVANIPMGIRLTMMLSSPGAGTLALQWAQNTSSADGTTVKAGSILRAKQIL